ncbi:MAG: hypothetical protein B7Z03_15055 [Hydrogenophilales bacterium 32-62-9]|nr:MAG: hypothetical protein B7Z03_15055 [Hydrogenophilales bacterium 32-62-9]
MMLGWLNTVATSRVVSTRDVSPVLFQFFQLGFQQLLLLRQLSGLFLQLLAHRVDFHLIGCGCRMAELGCDQQRSGAQHGA